MPLAILARPQAGPAAIIVDRASRGMREEERVLRIHRLLLDRYGDPPQRRHDLLSTLVSAILSQNTNDTNRDRALGRLTERFQGWEAVRDAPVEDVVDAIRPAGLGPTKAPRIQEALRRISAQQGGLELGFLGQLPLEEAREWLLGIPGVGPKTAAIVLLFGLGRPAFPVDTHVHRVSTRLGLLPEGTSREKAHGILEAIVPAGIYYPLHINLIALGRDVCHARGPEHEVCAVRLECPVFTELARGGEQGGAS
jgi:endonuclease-3